MAAPTSDLYNTSLAGSVLTLPVGGSTIVYLNEHVCYNSSGYVVPVANASGNVYIGYSLLHADGSGSATNGTVNTQVQLYGFGAENSLWVFNSNTNPTQAWAGSLVYWSGTDNTTVTQTAGSGIVAGVVMQVLTTSTTANSVVVNVARRSIT